jgi:hypothetical protein
MYIILGILVIFIIFFINTSNNKYFNKETFISTTFKNDNPQCPDYLAFDGTYYYLVNNNYPEKIETYKTLEEAHNKLDSLGCPKFKPISLVKSNINNKDPQEGIDRKCAKKVAINQFLEDIYNFSISEENISTENLNKDLDINKSINKLPSYLKEYNNSLAEFLGNNKPSEDATKEEIKLAINNYIKNASPAELTSYLQENCMINEYINDLEKTGGFYDNYNSINILDELVTDLKVTGKDSSITNDILEAKRNVENPLMDEVWNINKPITNLMMDKIFSI